MHRNMGDVAITIVCAVVVMVVWYLAGLYDFKHRRLRKTITWKTFTDALERRYSKIMDTATTIKRFAQSPSFGELWIWWAKRTFPNADQFLRCMIIESLNIKRRGAGEFLLEAMKDPNAGVRATAAEVFGSRVDDYELRQRAVPVFIDGFRDGSLPAAVAAKVLLREGGVHIDVRGRPVVEGKVSPHLLRVVADGVTINDDDRLPMADESKISFALIALEVIGGTEKAARTNKMVSAMSEEKNRLHSSGSERNTACCAARRRELQNRRPA